MIQRGERPTEDMEKQLDGLLSQVQGQANYQRLLVAQENFDKIDGQGERLDSRRHREGRGEPDHHAGLSPRNAARPTHRLRGRRGRGEDARSFVSSPSGSARANAGRRAAVREPGGTPSATRSAGSCSIRRRTSCRAPRRSCSWRRARSSSSARFAQRSSAARRCSSIDSSCRPTRTRASVAGCPKRSCASPTEWRRAGSCPISRCCSRCRSRKAWRVRCSRGEPRPHGARRAGVPRTRGAGVRARLRRASGRPRTPSVARSCWSMPLATRRRMYSTVCWRRSRERWPESFPS